MSTNLAYSLPAKPDSAGAHPRQIEVVTTRSQRRARPRVVYALIAVGGLLVIFLAQLMLSIALSSGAYQISGLLVEKRDLGRTQGALTEQLELLGSTQNLSANAENLGMVGSDAAVYLRLSDGKVIGDASAAMATSASTQKNLIANSLLTGVELVPASTDSAAESEVAAADGTATLESAATEGATAQVTETHDTASTSATGTESTETGAPSVGETGSSVASDPDALPSPVTH
jgi:NAD(P)H-nitrite reductase large subunit